MARPRLAVGSLTPIVRSVGKDAVDQRLAIYPRLGSRVVREETSFEVGDMPRIRPAGNLGHGRPGPGITGWLHARCSVIPGPSDWRKLHLPAKLTAWSSWQGERKVVSLAA